MTRLWSWGPSIGRTGPQTAHTSCRPPTYTAPRPAPPRPAPPHLFTLGPSLCPDPHLFPPLAHLCSVPPPCRLSVRSCLTLLFCLPQLRLCQHSQVQPGPGPRRPHRAEGVGAGLLPHAAPAALPEVRRETCLSPGQQQPALGPTRRARVVSDHISCFQRQSRACRWEGTSLGGSPDFVTSALCRRERTLGCGCAEGEGSLGGVYLSSGLMLKHPSGARQSWD